MRALAWLLVLALAGCDDMEQQRRYDAYGEAGLFADGKVLQLAPEGTVARDRPTMERPEMTAALLARGQERYAIFCAPCHDTAGYGAGVVPARGYPPPPSFHTPELRAAPESHFVEVITRGYGVMYSYADRVAPADRWAIAAYIRALQLSQHAPAADLPEDLQFPLEEQ